MEVSVATAVPARPGTLHRLGRPAEIVLGAAFVVGALFKAADINLFIVQLYHYGVFSLFLQMYLGLLIVLTEMMVGVLLILGGPLRRFLLTVATAMLLVYTAVIAYGWFRLGLDDCGCLGLVKTPPPLGMLKNFVLLAACAVAWTGTSRLRSYPRPRWFVRMARGAAKLAIAVLLTGVVVVYANDHVENIQPGVLGARPFSTYVFNADGKTLNLGKGEYFIAMLSTTCSHCVHAVAGLNQLQKQPGFPTVVGLCKGNSALLERFRNLSHPEFPLHLIGFRAFWDLLGMGPPRYYLERDGRVLAIWDYIMPSPQEVERARHKPESPLKH